MPATLEAFRAEPPGLTLVELFLDYVLCPETREPQTPLEQLLQGLAAALRIGVEQVVVYLVHAANPKRSPGYTSWLVERGVDPLAARIAAGSLICEGIQAASDARRLLEIAKAVQFLSKPGRQGKAATRSIELLITASRETVIFRRIFGNARGQRLKFVEALHTAASGDVDAYHRLRQLAAQIVPHLPVRRGPKISTASAMHEAFLEYGFATFNEASCTYDPVYERYSDSMTEATRLECGYDGFNPCSAYRRWRARQGPDRITKRKLPVRS